MSSIKIDIFYAASLIIKLMIMPFNLHSLALGWVQSGGMIDQSLLALIHCESRGACLICNSTPERAFNTCRKLLALLVVDECQTGFLALSPIKGQASPQDAQCAQLARPV